MNYQIFGNGQLSINQISNGFIVHVRIQKKLITDLNDLLKPEASPEANPVSTAIAKFNKDMGEPIPPDVLQGLTTAMSQVNKPIAVFPLETALWEVSIFFAGFDELATFIANWARGNDLAAYFPKEATREKE